jgi:hypothetical protein
MRLSTIASSLLCLAFFACSKDVESEDTDVTPPDPIGGTDADGDGVRVEDGDCEDSDPAVYPGAAEVCDGKDQNCNNALDEGLPDADSDGTCDALDAETCDGLDNDGNGQADETFGDLDADGVADCRDDESCDGVDNDGDGDVDEGYDADGDGYTQCGGADGALADCDDADEDVNPGASEIDRNRADEDCDGYIDENGWSEGDLVITEIMNNPASVADPRGEWIEIYNASGRTVVLNGMLIGDAAGTEAHQIADRPIVTMSPDSYLVLGSEIDAAINGDVPVSYQYLGVTLNNGADDFSISVVNDSGDTVVIDAVSWDDGVMFPNGSGASMTLESSYVDAGSNDEGMYWCAATAPWAAGTDNGSPGEANLPCDTFDHDGDGFSRDDGDCDDDDETVYPGAPETDKTKDNDCDGVVEWGPTADARLGSGSDAEECGAVYLDAKSSSDPDGGTPLTYKWELTSAPTASGLTTADIVNATTSLATFYPDAEGTYVFSLTVYDKGMAASVPDTLDVVVAARSSNATPVADAGTSQSASSSASCTASRYGDRNDCDLCADRAFSLTGALSSDGDGDSLHYQWTITSGVAVIDDDRAASPTLSVSSPAVTEGATTTNTVNVDLVVTDCMGAVSTTDTVVISYSCTGT